MTELPDVKLRGLTNFPVRVTGRTATTIEKINGQWYVDHDVSALVQNDNISAGEVAQSRMTIWNSVTDAYETVPYALAATSGVSSIDGHTGALSIGDGLQFTGDTLELDIGVGLTFTGSTLELDAAYRVPPAYQYDTRAAALAATIPVTVANVTIKREAAGYPISNAPYVQGTIAGPRAFLNNGVYWELDLTAGIVKAAWFGIKTATDSTTAFQACLDAVKAAGGRLIEVDPGTYIITSQLTYITTSSNPLTPGLDFVGAGKYVTFFDNRVAGTALTSAFTTTNGSVIVGVAWPSHGKSAADVFTLRNCSRSSSVTITVASPGVVTWTAHGIVANGDVILSTSGTLPTGLVPGKYYVKTVLGVDTFTLSATPGGAVINTTGAAGSGHTGTTNTIGGLCMDGSWEVASVPDANSITFNHAAAASSAVATGKGSANVNKAMLKIATSIDGKFQFGGGLKDFSIITTTSPIASTGVEMRSTYRTRNDFNVNGMTGDAVCIPCTRGDSGLGGDGANQNHFDGRWENCGGWGWIVDNPAHNEVSGTTLGDVFMQSCGTASLFSVPPSGGIKWKGQGLHLTKPFFTICNNVGIYLPGGPNASNTVTYDFVVLENTIAPVGAAWLIEGAIGIIGNVVQIYQNDTYKARYGIRGDSTVNAVVDMDGAYAILRVSAGNNPHTAFSTTGSNADNINIRLVRQLLYGGAGQTLYDTWPVA